MHASVPKHILYAFFIWFHYSVLRYLTFMEPLIKKSVLHQVHVLSTFHELIINAQLYWKALCSVLFV